MKFKHLVFGIATNIPGVFSLFVKSTGDSISARYCYSVWLRHMVMARKSGWTIRPRAVAELGPGDSLGVGLAALITGAERYFAFDVVRYADLDKNLELFDKLVVLFRSREDIPDDKEFPKIKPLLQSYDFPRSIFCDEYLDQKLKRDRIEKIRNSIENMDMMDSAIRYVVPWHTEESLDEESIDMIFSQAVMQYVDDLPSAYRSMYRWLRPNGLMSHQINFTAHQTSNKWNGHWGYSDFFWKCMRGKQPFWLNRAPHSEHIRLIRDCGFNLVRDDSTKARSAIARNELAPNFRNMSDEDFITSGVFVQATKRSCIGREIGNHKRSLLKTG